MASDDAARARIISHMNASHAESLSAYLQYYNRVPLSAASKPTMVDISLSSMIIRDASQRSHTVRFSPPLTSFADARVRTVAMDAAARRALGVRITAYEPPTKPLHRLLFGLCCMVIVLDFTHDRIMPGTFMYDVVLRYWPGGPEWFLWLVRAQVVPVALIHYTEMFLLDRTRLTRYGVQRWSGLWWKWMMSCLIEGLGTFQRIDAEVKRQETAWDREREREKEQEAATKASQH
jgi:hypothetical protein